MKKIAGSLFILDQAISSLITFVLIAGLSHAGGAALVGSIAVLQTIALAGLSASRAVGVDVWAASAAVISDRRGALSSGYTVALAVLFINIFAAFLQKNGGFPVVLYCIVSPLIVVLDTVRIFLLHSGKTWISVILQGLILTGVIISAYTASGAEVLLMAYLVGVFITVAVGHAALKIRPPLPSIRYPIAHRHKSGPFLLEISLGSITQQALFLIVTVLSSVQTGGQIRIAQTLLGPLSIVYSGLAPQLLRKLGRLGVMNRRAVARNGRNFGLLLAGCSVLCVSLLCVALNIDISGFSLLKFLTGHQDNDLPTIVAVCGTAVAFGGVVLGVGTSARVIGTTSNLNRWRLLLIGPQVVAVCAGALAGSPLMAAAGLAGASAATAIMSLIVLTRSVPRRSRRYSAASNYDRRRISDARGFEYSKGGQ